MDQARREGRSDPAEIDSLLRDLADQHQTLLDSLPLAILSYARDGRILTHNPACNELIGAPRELDLTGQNIFTLVHPDDLPRFRSQAERIFSQGGTDQPECFRFLRSDGSVGHAEGDAALLVTPDGPRIVLYAQDVSARIEAEQALRQREVELAALTDNSPDAIVRFDTELRVLFANRAYLRFTGNRPQRVLHRHLQQLDATRAVNNQWQEALQAALKSGQRRDLNFHFDTPQGPREFSARIVPECDESGHIRSLLTVTRDVTEMAQARHALEQHSLALAERVKEQRVLLGISALLADPDLDEERLIAEAVELIPPGWQEPTLTGARIQLDGHQVAASNWAKPVRSATRPILVNGEPIGLLEVGLHKRGPKEFLAEELGLLDTLASLIGEGISTRRTRTREQRQTRALEALSQVGRSLVNASDEDTLLREVCQAIIRAGYRMAWVGMARNARGKPVEPVASAGHVDGYLKAVKISWGRGAHGQGPAGRAMRSGRPVVFRAAKDIDSFKPWREAALKRGYRSVSALPLRLDGEERGVLAIYAPDPQAFDGPEMELLAQIADELAHGLRALRGEQRGRQQTLQLQRALSQTISAITLTVEKRDPYTAGHQQRVAALARAIAQRLGLEAERTEGIRVGASIHDIGKIAIPSELLSKPTRLNGAEMALIRTHAATSAEIVAGIEFPWPIEQMIRQHHERLDGSGYPDGLKGDEILLEARIIAVADVVESMATHRPYRASLGIDAALREIRSQAGQTLDADVVMACEQVFADGFELPLAV